MQLIPQWRKCWRRHSTWLLAAASGLSAAVSFMPSVQAYVDPETYKTIMLGLSVATFIVLQIKQDSVS